VRTIKIKERRDVRSEVILRIRDKRGVFSYIRPIIMRLKIINKIVIIIGKNIAGFSPSLASPHGS
jgi:hypothetical protein